MIKFKLPNLFARNAPKKTEITHPLIRSAKAYMAAVEAYESHCDQLGIYAAAESAKIEYRRMSRVSIFGDLNALIAKASEELKDTEHLGKDTIEEFIKIAARLKTIALHGKSALFFKAQKNYESLGRNFRGPDMRNALQGFISIAESYIVKDVPLPKDIQDFLDAAEKVGAALDGNRPGSIKRPITDTKPRF